MVRGVVPRQPGRRGKQEGVKHTPQARKPSVSAERARPRLSAKSPAGQPPSQTAQAKIKGGMARPEPAKSSSHPSAVKPAARYDPVAPERVAALLKLLDETYPGATCALHHASAWELLVATILSAQCTDARVNMVTPELFRRYPTVHDFARLRPEQLEPEIRSTGFFRNKAKSLVGAARKIVEDHGADVPQQIEQLIGLPGVARKTANVVLGTWFGKAEGVVVDTHVQRISRRLELTDQNDPPKIELDLMRVIPRDKWIIFAHQIILHGRALCLARQPRCADCPLETLCHAADKTWSTVEVHKNAK